DTHPQAVRQMNVVKEAIRAVRNIRSERGVPPSKPVPMTVRCQDSEAAGLMESVRPYLIRLCNLSTLDIGVELKVPKLAVTAVVTGAEIYLPLAGLVDLDAERARLQKERQRLMAEVERVDKKLANPQFVAKAPPEVVAAEQEKASDYRAKLAAVEERLAALAQA
ncbi:MAG: valine--tRNA ligase, partial [Alicyclobacillus sp.]|nr:valine--tRNA ligase [Alicyclobacillus sp.]